MCFNWTFGALADSLECDSSIRTYLRLHRVCESDERVVFLVEHDFYTLYIPIYPCSTHTNKSEHARLRQREALNTQRNNACATPSRVRISPLLMLCHGRRVSFHCKVPRNFFSFKNYTRESVARVVRCFLKNTDNFDTIIFLS